MRPPNFLSTLAPIVCTRTDEERAVFLYQSCPEEKNIVDALGINMKIKARQWQRIVTSDEDVYLVWFQAVIIFRVFRPAN